MKKETKQFVIYSRKSKFTGKGESIENQIELCRQYISVHFSQEEADAALVYEDEGFSGGNLERPQFKKMMKDSQKTKFAAIVVYRLDRISRNIGDFAKLIEDLGDRHIDFISIREQFDTSSPMGRAMMYIASVFSQLERETIAERIRDNMHELSKTGRWLGGTTPTGYESESISNVTVDGKVRKACKLKIIPEEISLVQLIFEKFLETGSLTKVDAFLLEKRYTTKRGKNFTRFAIKGILTNPVYMIADEAAYGYLTENHVDLFAEKSDFDGKHGIMAYNRTLQRPGKAHQIRPMEEWIVSVGKHPGVIPGQQWIQVQSMLEVNKSKSYRRPRSNVALLSGLLVCGDCGDYMRPKLTNRHAANGELIYTYMCSTKERSQSSRCQMKNANGNTLDAKVISEIKKLSEDRSFFADFLAQTKKVISGNREGYDAELLTLKEKLAENESSIKALVSSLTKSAGTSVESYIMEQIQELHQTGEDMKNRLAELETLTEHQRFADQEFAFSRQMIESFAANVDDCTVEEKRRLLRAIVKKVVWDGENAWVYLFAGEGEADLPPFDAPKVPLSEDSEAYVHIEDWRNRPLQGGRYPYVYVDGIYLRRNWGGEYENVAILVAIAVNEDGFREVLGAAEGMKEDKASWVSFFQWLRGRGLDGVKLIVGDKCMGMLEAVGEVFPDAKYQRCTVHFYRNVFSVVPKSKVKIVAKMLKAIHAQESKKASREKAKTVVAELRAMKLKEAAKKVEDGIEETLTYCDFPSEHWTRHPHQQRD